MPRSGDAERPQEQGHPRKASVSDLAPPVLLEGEDRAEYNRLFAAVMDSVVPRDALEKLWVEDVVYLVWEARRLRILKAHLLRSSARHGLQEILGPLMREIGDTDVIRSLHGQFSSADVLVRDWYANDPKARSEVDALLKKAGLSMADVMAQTLALKMDDIDQIDRMIALSEARRNGALREIDRHRSALAAQLELALAEIEDAGPVEGEADQPHDG